MAGFETTPPLANGKLTYRDLYHIDAAPLMAALVGASAVVGGGDVVALPTAPAAGGYGGPGGTFSGAGAAASSTIVRPVKATININTNLTIQEVRQVGGHAVGQ